MQRIYSDRAGELKAAAENLGIPHELSEAGVPVSNGAKHSPLTGQKANPLGGRTRVTKNVYSIGVCPFLNLSQT